MKNKEQHVWYFPNAGLKALFDREIRGQLSDGAWENSVPHRHWYFWNALAVEVGSDWSFKFNPKHDDYESRHPVKKSGYNLLCLVDPNCVDLSARMRAYYVDGLHNLGFGDDVDYLLGTGTYGHVRVLSADEVRVNLNKHAETSEYWKEKLARVDRNLEERLAKFKDAYELYSRKDLIKDLRLLKQQMKVVAQMAA
jgi:hypothetical protein